LSRWLAALPSLDALWVVTRWRIMLVACLAFAAAAALDQLLAADRPGVGAPASRDPATFSWRARLGRVLVWAAPVELVVLLLPTWLANVCPFEDRPLTRARLGLPQTPWMVAVAQVNTERNRRVYYRLFEANVGAVQGYDPLFGYMPAPSARLYHGHPRYRGEHVIDGGPVVTPAHWSPNHLRFARLPAGRTLQINLNPGRGWSMNGQPLFVDHRLFDLRRPFSVTVPTSGTVELRYTPPGLHAGIALALAAWALLLGYWRIPRLLARRQQRKAAAPLPPGAGR
jgi:hypothetical protein